MRSKSVKFAPSSASLSCCRPPSASHGCLTRASIASSGTAAHSRAKMCVPNCGWYRDHCAMAYCDRTFRSACDISALVWNSAAEKHAEPISPSNLHVRGMCAQCSAVVADATSGPAPTNDEALCRSTLCESPKSLNARHAPYRIRCRPAAPSHADSPRSGAPTASSLWPRSGGDCTNNAIAMGFARTVALHSASQCNRQRTAETYAS